MQAVRIIVWAAFIAVAVLFSMNNWTPVDVMIWEGLVLETKVPALMFLSFLIGFLPMWLVHYGARWRLRRRIRSLESAAQSTTSSFAVQEPEPHLTDSKTPETL